MFVSAEIRWFWPGERPALAAAQFHQNGTACDEEKIRTDIYRRLAGQAELSVKQRGKKAGFETKGLVAIRPLPSGCPASSCQIWCKWSADSNVPREWPQFAVTKTRRLRRFGTDDSQQGCRLELTRLEIPTGEIWWTLGFEAFAELDRLVGQLMSAIAQSSLTPEAIQDGLFLSYPAWIEHLHRVR